MTTTWSKKRHVSPQPIPPSSFQSSPPPQPPQKADVLSPPPPPPPATAGLEEILTSLRRGGSRLSGVASPASLGQPTHAAAGAARPSFAQKLEWAERANACGRTRYTCPESRLPEEWSAVEESPIGMPPAAGKKAVVVVADNAEALRLPGYTWRRARFPSKAPSTREELRFFAESVDRLCARAAAAAAATNDGGGEAAGAAEVHTLAACDAALHELHRHFVPLCATKAYLLDEIRKDTRAACLRLAEAHGAACRRVAELEQRLAESSIVVVGSGGGSGGGGGGASSAFSRHLSAETPPATPLSPVVPAAAAFPAAAGPPPPRAGRRRAPSSDATPCFAAAPLQPPRRRLRGASRTGVQTGLDGRRGRETPPAALPPPAAAEVDETLQQMLTEYGGGGRAGCREEDEAAAAEAAAAAAAAHAGPSLVNMAFASARDGDARGRRWSEQVTPLDLPEASALRQWVDEPAGVEAQLAQRVGSLLKNARKAAAFETPTPVSIAERARLIRDAPASVQPQDPPPLPSDAELCPPPPPAGEAATGPPHASFGLTDGPPASPVPPACKSCGHRLITEEEVRLLQKQNPLPS